jgi:hypothetical protein
MRKQPIVLPPEMTEAMKCALGMPNFRCHPYAVKLRQLGHEIPERAEDEQAHVILFLLRFAIVYGDRAPAHIKQAFRLKREPWPSDAVMIVAADAGKENRAKMQGVHKCRCRDCSQELHADTKTLQTAEQVPERRDRPVLFFCWECYQAYDLNTINTVIDQSGLLNPEVNHGNQ